MFKQLQVVNPTHNNIRSFSFYNENKNLIFPQTRNPSQLRRIREVMRTNFEEDKHDGGTTTNSVMNNNEIYEQGLKKMIMMHFPRDVTKNCLKWNQKAIILVYADNGDTYDAEIHCAKRNGKIVWKEKFIIKGWYEYAKKKRIRRQDVLGFKIRYPLERLYVSSLKRLVMRK
ncbi:hypothetical protein KIW84_056173 [Lathyrus oleraceus]|uniref:Uncharacterized protein n=1 Tax=Pisum sativum TaxID=3888 RepID=A0A9D4X0H4_PEA|nr:hypothetical protein KIW84_056173 [Pisum sativum]